MVERMTRWLARLATLPSGPTFPLPVTLGQVGDALWVLVEGEHYQLLQTALRQRFGKVGEGEWHRKRIAASPRPARGGPNRPYYLLGDR